MTSLHDLACAIHVHSTYSDGTATVPEIVAAAEACGRDVVMLTDHDTLEARRRGCEGWHGSVLVLVGEEVSGRRGHYLAFGHEEEVGGRRLDEEEIPAAVAAAGGFGFAAHPFSRRSRISKLIGRPHPWRPLEDPDLTGVELWSLQTDAAEAWRGPREAMRFLADPEGSLDGPPSEHLRVWDRLCAKRPTVAIGGLDAHQKGLRLRGRPLSPMPHRRYLGLLSTHLLCEEGPRGELEADREQVFAALRAGRCYLCRDSLADPRGFGFWASRDGGTAHMGKSAEGGGWTLIARVPRAARLRLLRDGRPLAFAEGRRLSHAASRPGAYRLEAALPSAGEPRTWILSNPIYLR